jgi:hypothetical protein
MRTLFIWCILLFLFLICGCISSQDQCIANTSCRGLRLAIVKLVPNERTSYSDPFIFHGTAINIDNCTIEQGTIGILFYDEKGNSVDNVSTLITCINPNETKDFELYYSGSKLELIRKYNWYVSTGRED